MKNECEFNWFGQPWKCLRIDEGDDDNFGGECVMKERTIRINIKYDDADFLEYLHHELMEGAVYLTACSFAREYPDNENIFIMNHAQMDVISSAVRGAYEMIKKSMGAENCWTEVKKTSSKSKRVVKKSRPRK